MSAPLVTLIAKQHQQCSTSSLTEALQNQIAITSAQRKALAKCIRMSTQSAAVQDTLPSLLAYAMTLSQEQGASTWLTARPIEEHGFALHKTAFRDSIALRNGWEPINLSSHCACGETFNTNHALSCPTGGFLIVRHNEVRDFTAGLLRKVTYDVEIEPKLKPLTGEDLAPSAKHDAALSSHRHQGTRSVGRIVRMCIL